MSLFEHLCEETRYSEATVCYYMEQVLQALQYMHGRRIIYLDLKVNNRSGLLLFRSLLNR